MDWFLFWFLGIGSFVGLIGYILYQNRIVAGPRASEVVVIADNRQNMQVLRHHTFLLPPGWDELVRLDTNPDPKTHTEVCKTSDGAHVSVELLWETILGRLNDANGIMQNEDEVDDEEIKRLVTEHQIKKGEETVHALLMFRKAIDETLGEYKEAELILPSKEKPKVPRNLGSDELWMVNDGHIVNEVECDSDLKLAAQLELLIKLRTNRKLADRGQSIKKPAFTGQPKYADPQFQKNLETGLRTALLKKALPGLTDAELAAANGAEFGQVVQGVGNKRIGIGLDGIGAGLERGFKGLGDGIARAGEAMGRKGP